MDISSKDRYGDRGQPEVKTIPVTEVSVNGDNDFKIYTKDGPPVFPINSSQNMNVLRSRDANKASILLKTTPYSLAEIKTANTRQNHVGQLKGSKSTTANLRADI